MRPVPLVKECDFCGAIELAPILELTAESSRLQNPAPIVEVPLVFGRKITGREQT
jgi:hypothetical protein